MAYEIGTLLKAGGDDAHYQMLAAIKALAEANGWVTMRYDTVSADREWIGKSTGLSGVEEIYVGFRTYQSFSGDYYNLVAGTFIGYVPGNSFDSQPGAYLSGVPAHNNAITYYMIVNQQRIALAMKVGTPVYESAYVGKMFPDATPGEFPSPLVCAGMLNGVPATRYSDTSANHTFGYLSGTSAQLRLRSNMGSWIPVNCWPYDSTYLAGTYNDQPTGVYYQPQRIELNDASNCYGSLDGVYFITGFNNAVENVLQIGGTPVDQTGMDPPTAVAAVLAAGGRAFVVIQNAHRTGFDNYCLMEMV